MRRLHLGGLLFLIAVLGEPAAAAVDVDAMWDYTQPAVSEQRFREALRTAGGDDALVLLTQVARSWGLRRDFVRARKVLEEVEERMGASPQVQARYWLETGRTYASAAHDAAQVTPQDREQAQAAFGRALQVARRAGLDVLAIDAIHMLAFVDTAPTDQLRHAQEALAVAQASTQPAARRWEPSIRNNLGYALHQLGRYDEALAQFEEAVRLRRQGTNAAALRDAQWMVAWTLRSLRRADEALALQLALEREGDAAGQPDPYVFEELEILYRERGDAERAAQYAKRLRAARDSAPR